MFRKISFSRRGEIENLARSVYAQMVYVLFSRLDTCENSYIDNLAFYENVVYNFFKVFSIKQKLINFSSLLKMCWLIYIRQNLCRNTSYELKCAFDLICGWLLWYFVINFDMNVDKQTKEKARSVQLHFRFNIFLIYSKRHWINFFASKQEFHPSTNRRY